MGRERKLYVFPLLGDRVLSDAVESIEKVGVLGRVRRWVGGGGEMRVGEGGQVRD